MVVSLTDPLGGSVGAHTVTARKIVGTRSEAPVVEDEAFTPVSCDKGDAGCAVGQYRLNLMSQPRERDVYSLLITLQKESSDGDDNEPDTLDAAPELDADPIDVERNLKLTVSASVREMALSIKSDTEWDLANATKFPYPEASNQTLHVGLGQHMKVSFQVIEASGVAYEPHQLFLRFQHKEMASEAVFVPKLVEDSHEAVVMHADLSRALHYKSGTYRVALVIGDIFLDESKAWHFCDVEVTTEPQPFRQAPLNVLQRSIQPEIRHTFKDPPAQPFVIVSLAFGGLAGAPLVIFIGALSDMRAFRLDRFPKREEDPSAFWASVAFLGGFAAMAGVIVLYWLGMAFGTALWWMVALAVFTVCAGRTALGSALTVPKPLKGKAA